MTTTHLVTGSTGFIGGALVLELLRRTADRVVVLARPGNTSSEQRFLETAARAIELYGATLPLAEVQSRCRVIAGELHEPGCGVREPVGPVDHVWHAAASLRYEDRHREQIYATNVEGTRRTLELARRLEAGTFNYISTAYVAGRAAGLIRERIVDDIDSNNHYERSKVEAERLVAQLGPPRWRILRPSVVVGHSRTCTGTSQAGFYGFLRELVQFRGMVDRAQRGLLVRTGLRIRADPGTPIDLVPIDRVAEEAVQVGLQDTTGVFHLTHPNTPTVGRVIDTFFSLLELHPPQYVTTTDELDWLGARFDERLAFYGSYINGNKRFDRSRTDAALAAPSPAADLVYDDAAIAALARPYLAALADQRRNLPAAR